MLTTASPCALARAQSYAQDALGRALSASTAHLDGANTANPAALGALAAAELSFWTTSLYGLDELRLMSVRVTAPVGRTRLATTVHDISYDEFRQLDAALTFAVPVQIAIQKQVLAGVSVAVRRIAALPGETAYSHSIRTGILIPVNARMAVAAVFHRLLDSAPFSRSAATIGTSYSTSNRLTFYLDLHSEVGFPAAYRMGVRANPSGNLILVIGAGTNPDTLSGGFAVDVGRISIRTGADYHMVLGLSTSMQMSIRIGKRRDGYRDS